MKRFIKDHLDVSSNYSDENISDKDGLIYKSL